MHSQFVCYQCGTANQLVAQKAQPREAKGSADCHICRMLNRSRCCFSHHKYDSNGYTRPKITVSKSVDQLPPKTARQFKQKYPYEINSPILMLKRPVSTTQLSTAANVNNVQSQQIVYVPTERKVIYYEPVIYQKLATPSTAGNTSTILKKKRGLTQTRDLLARKLDFNAGYPSYNGGRLTTGRPVPPEVLRQHIKDYLRPYNRKFAY